MKRKIDMDDLWDNCSFAVRNNDTLEKGYIKIKDFFENVEVDNES